MPAKARWDGNNPFHQPAPTTDYYDSGDIDGDGVITEQDVALAGQMADRMRYPSSMALSQIVMELRIFQTLED